MPRKVTANDQGPGVNLAAWISMVVMCLVVLTKVISRLLTTRKLTRDNFFVLIAGTLAVGQTVAVSEQVSSGLGQHQATLNTNQIEGFQKAEYAAELLYVAALGFSKASSFSFLVELVRQHSTLAFIQGSIIFTAVWMIVAILSISFQCGLPHPWATLSDHCFNQTLFWGFVEAFDIISVLLLAGVPIYVLWDLQVAFGKKLSVLSAFGSRILVVPLLVLRIIYTASAFKASDRTYAVYKLVVVTHVAVMLDLILCCVPFLKPFMDELDNGIFTSDLRFAPGATTSESQGSYALRSLGRSSDKPSKRSNNSTVLTRPWFRTSMSTTIAANTRRVSRPSSIGSGERIIKQTKTFGVESDGVEFQDV